VSSLASLTVGLWLSTAADGPTNTTIPIFSIGDVTNRLARGIVLWDNHSVVGMPTYFGRWNTTSSAGQSPPRNPTFWHWVVLQIRLAPNQTQVYVDNTFSSAASMGSIVPALSTDPLLISSTESISVAHVCFWNRALTLAEIQSVSNEHAPWPFTEPVNTPPQSGGGGGGLTEEQATQLSQIDTKTDDIPGMVDALEYITDVVNVLSTVTTTTDDKVDALDGKMNEALGHLNTLLAVTSEQVLPNIAEVRDFVSRLLYSAGGIALNAGVGSLIAHPDPNLLHESVEEYLISGQGTLPSPGPLNYGNVYAVRWRTVEQPAGAGVRYGVVPEFTRRLVQWALYYTDVGSLVSYPQVIADFTFESYTYYWPRYAPTEIAYHVAPGFVLGVRYIMFAPTP